MEAEESQPGGIDAALIQLEQEIVAYLNYETSKHSTDQGSAFLWAQQNAKVEMPPAFLLYRKLKTYAGRDGSIPFVEDGGYYDQPYLTSLALEACARIDRQFSQRHAVSSQASEE